MTVVPLHPYDERAQQMRQKELARNLLVQDRRTHTFYEVIDDCAQINGVIEHAARRVFRQRR
jgi:hypothetical protein